MPILHPDTASRSRPIGLGAVPPTWWRLLVGLGALLVAAAVLVPGHAGEAAYLVTGAAGVLALVVGTRLNQPRHAGPWWAFALGLGVWVVADALLFLGADTLSDALFVVGYFPLAAGLALLARVRVRGADLAGVLDAAVLTVALTLAFWVLLGGPVLDAATFSTSETVVELAYVVGDLLLLGGLVRIATSPGGWHLPMRALAGAIALVVVGDVLSLSLRMYGGVAEPVLPDVAYLGSYLLWGAAALHPRMLDLTEPSRPRSTVLGPGRMAALGLAATSGTWCLAAQLLLGDRLSVWPVVVGTAGLVVLVLARLRLAFGEIVAAHTESTSLRDRLSHEATHDHLTGLPNRARGLVLLEEALDRVHHAGGSVTVLFIDLDGFKKINDTFGHRAGDRLLVEVADRLRDATRGGDTAIRLGGDEFVVVLQGVPDPETAVSLARRLIATVSEPVGLGGLGTARVGASVGVSQCFDGTTDAVTLLDEADMAAYRAKNAGRGRAELFDLDMRAAAREAERLTADLRRAVADDQLELHYQPVLDVHSGQVRGWEALVRWNRPGEGQLLPGAFLPTAERSGLIVDIDRWVARTALEQLARWSADHHGEELAVAVNPSRRRLLSAGLVPDLLETLEATGLQPRQLVLEVDHAVVAGEPGIAARLGEARATGVRVALADFDAGFRSLRALGGLPVDYVKIGADFLLIDSSEDVKLLHLVIQGARAVGLDVVAEGVEHANQLATLRALDCAMVQGFHLARPMPAEQAGARLLVGPADRFSGLLR